MKTERKEARGWKEAKRVEQESVQMTRGGKQERILIKDLKHKKYIINDNKHIFQKMCATMHTITL